MTSPLELLAPDPDRIPTVLDTIWGPALGATMGFGAMCFVNFGTRRPVLSGIQKHIVTAGVGALIGQYAEKNRHEYLAERDAVLRHYIELHPEDFPTPERKKWSDVIRPWIPIR